MIGGRNHGCRWDAVRVRGFEVILLENRWLRVSVVPAKGADVAEFLFKPTDTDFLWRSPWPLARHAVPQGGDPDLAFLASYHGGWQELFPTCGDAADLGGMRIGVHGEACLLPWEWEVEHDTPERVTIAFEVAMRRTPFRLRRKMTFRHDRAALFLEESAVNEGASEQTFMWGHHPAFGPPFLKPGVRIDTDARTVLTSSVHEDPASRLAPDQRSAWPHARTVEGATVDLSVVAGPDRKTHDWAYLTDFEDGWFAIRDPIEQVAFACRWPAEVLPYALVWQNYRGAQAAPWHGRTYVVAIEPQSTFPADYARGDPLLRLGPGETLELSLVAAAWHAPSAIRSVSRDGRVVVEGTPA